MMRNWQCFLRVPPIGATNFTGHAPPHRQPQRCPRAREHACRPRRVDPSPIRRAVAVGDQSGLEHRNMITDVMFPAMMTSPLHTMADIREINSSITESMCQLYPSWQPSTPAPPGSTSRSSSSRARPTSRPPPNAHEHFATKVQPPIAEFATIPETGHLVAFTRPDEFLRLLVERVLPVCEPHHP
jgi:hypothetical protein